MNLPTSDAGNLEWNMDYGPTRTDESAFGRFQFSFVETNEFPRQTVPQPTVPLPTTGSPTLQDTGYNLRTHRILNPAIDPSELLRQKAISEQRSLAASWTRICKDVEDEINHLQRIVYTTWDYISATASADKLQKLWTSLESAYERYLPGIKDRKRLEAVVSVYNSLEERTAYVNEEYRKQIQSAIKPDQGNNPNTSYAGSSTSRRSETSRERLRIMLMTKKKLELARARQEEEAEIAKSMFEMNARRELRRLEEEAAIAEVEWRVEVEYEEEEEVNPIIDVQDGIRHSTPLDNLTKVLRSASVTTPQTNLTTNKGGANIPPIITSQPSYLNANSEEKIHPTVPSSVRLHNDSRPLPTPQPSTSYQASNVSCGEHNSPVDHLAAMLKIQLLNGIRPTQFGGNPSDFPFFRKQLREHLESELLSDAQRVEYLPKFLCGEALEVVRRNRGCSYGHLVKTLEDRFGRPVQVSQACIEELVSGPKLNYGDNAGLLNFAERLNTATKILTGPDEQEISVATNLRKIINRLPNDLITKWQNENYEIVRRGSSARLKDISDFVLKHASIRNDPVYGLPKRDNKDVKNTARLTRSHPPTQKQSTVAVVNVEKQSTDRHVDQCDVCKGSLHNLKDCPIIKQCDHVDIRRQYAASYRFCFNCGKQRPGHGSGACPDTPSCSRCHGRHLDILHKDAPASQQVSVTASRERSWTDINKGPSTGKPALPKAEGSIKPSSKPQMREVSSAALNATTSSVVLNVLPVVIDSNDGKSLSTYAFLDNGCTDTLIDQRLADQLNIKGVPEEIHINTITANHQANTQRVSFTIRSPEGDEKIGVKEAYVLPDLNQSNQVLPESVDISCCPHLQDIKFPTVDVPRISILIGSNVPSAHIQREVRPPHDDKNGLYGCRYLLGWALCGPISADAHRTASLNSISIDCHLDEALERFWKIESSTVSVAQKELSVEDQRALEIIEKTTKFVDGHYEVGLPWRDVDPRLPDNRIVAEKRLEMLKRRLLKPGNEELASKYREGMQNYIAKGYARKLTQDEINAYNRVRWYLPHHPVTNPNKPEKVRIVFDAAAEFDGASLNKALLQGPDSTNSLIGVLLRFRKGNVDLAADIESMFHQVRVPEQDQHALPFFWWTDGYDKPPDVYVMQVHVFGATSSPCVVNSILRRTANDNSNDFSDETVAAVKNNFYVDDGLPSCADAESAASLANELVELLHRGGFNLTKFTSNSKDVLAVIPTQRRAKPELDLDLDELPVERALGVRWHVECDELGFTIRDLDRPETKRGILSTVCSLYDPLGMAAPVILQAKNLIQDLWRAKVDWDEPLAETLLVRWREWKNSLPCMAGVRIPRCFSPKFNLSQCQLPIHLFADASELGYGTVSYLRVRYPDGTIHCSFLMGRSRNAPVKFTTIPRLELQASVLATRMNNSIRAELDLEIERTQYWTDSEIVLHYLRNVKRRFQTFVANRVQQIKENSHVEEWRHVPGVLNPADDASRGYAASQLSSDGRWLHGPDFLWREESCWPDDEIITPCEEVLELKKETNLSATNVKVQGESTKPPKATNSCLLQQVVESCSSWTALLRRIAWLARFVRYIRDRESIPTGNLTLDEIENAEVYVAKIAQQTCFQDEIKDLRSGRRVNQSSKIANLNPTLDTKQALRVNGRVTSGPTTRVTTQPLIVPKDHHVATLLITYIHQICGHLGREHVLSKMREKFWIPQARVLARSILRRCLVCKRLNSKPVTQQMAPLPSSRTAAYEPPFTRTGMDLFGPLYVKHGRGTAKRWCCLFTCLTTRAVHLEVVHSMNTDDFIMCLRRFLNRRGDVVELRCDNGTNFVGAERELKESLKAWNQDQIEKELIQRDCKLIFQPPTASSMSGIWERLVRSAKTVLKSILGTYTVCDTVLSTVLTEVERILNGRALTANSDDPSDLDPLTPAHFLLQRKVISLPPGVFCEADGILRRKWRQAQFLIDLFWSRWIKEYLPLLQVRSKWLSIKPNLKPNDLVLLVDDNVPRGRWNLGRVLETYPGSDGLVRIVKVKTKSGEFLRPIQKLCLLENDLK